MKRRYYAAVDRFRTRYIRAAMRSAEGRVRDAAQLAGIGRTEFYKLLARYAPELAPRRGVVGNAAWRSLEGHRPSL